MESAISLFVTKGFQQTSMAQLSRSSGLAIGTIYHYFKGKDELIEQTYLYVTEHFGAFIAFDENELTLPLKERFRLVWIRSYAFFVTHPNYFFFKDTLTYSPLISAKLKEEAVKYYQVSFDIINEGIDTGVFTNKNPVALARWIYNALITPVQLKLSDQLEVKDELLNEFFEMTWKGLTSKQ
jgi:AcrR family transcriptional regulator